MRFSHTFEIHKRDIDLHEHVNNVAYLRWIQEVAVAHWNSAASEETRQRFTWIVLRHEIDYKKPAFEGELITAETWVGKAAKTRCERFTVISRKGEMLVQAKSVWCLLDTSTRRPSRVASEMRSVFNMQRGEF